MLWDFKILLPIAVCSEAESKNRTYTCISVQRWFKHICRLRENKRHLSVKVFLDTVLLLLSASGVQTSCFQSWNLEAVWRVLVQVDVEQ